MSLIDPVEIETRIKQRAELLLAFVRNPPVGSEGDVSPDEMLGIEQKVEKLAENMRTLPSVQHLVGYERRRCIDRLLKMEMQFGLLLAGCDELEESVRWHNQQRGTE